MSASGQRRAIRAALAACGSAAARMRAMTSSMLATATTRPTTMCARSRALARSNAVRRRITSSRKVEERLEHVPRPSCSGRPPRSETMLMPKLVCSEVNLNSWLRTMSGSASRLTSITTRTPCRSLSSRRSAIPSTFFSRYDLGDPLDHPGLVDLVGHLGDDDRGAAAHLLEMGLGADDDRCRGPRGRPAGCRCGRG